MPVPKSYWIRGSIGKKWNPCEYRKTVLTSTEKWKNRCEYRKIIESGRVPGKSGICASTGKLSWRVSKNDIIGASNEKLLNPGEYREKSGIRASIEKLSWRVPKNGRIGVSTAKLLNPGEYREKVESVRVPENCPDEYRKMVESVWVPENYWIRASIGKKWNPCEYRKTVLTSTEKW